MEKAIFAAGCFWGVEAAFGRIKGVSATRVGYAGGHLSNPTYKDVCKGDSGHAEAVEVTYDPSLVSYGDLLEAFWHNHNPTTLNRQGPDVGPQYRSVIFFHNAAQQQAAVMSRDEVQKRLQQRVVTEIVPAGIFYVAEEYHQHYHAKHGGACGL